MSRLRFAAGPYVALALLGFSVVWAARIANPGPRVGARARLIDLIEREDDIARGLRAEFDALQAEVEALEARAASGEASVAELQRQVEALGSGVGLAAVEGPGVRVELRDSSLRESPTGDINDLVIHEQDLQAVVNGLWGAGAEAIAINGERLIASSAVRCVGNTLLLHGAVYAPPYRIEAVGDPAALLGGLESDALVEHFRIFAEELMLGFDTARADTLRLAAFRGSISASIARVV